MFLHLSSEQAQGAHIVLSHSWLPGTPMETSPPSTGGALRRSPWSTLFFTPLLQNCILLGGLPGFLPILKILDSIILRNPKLIIQLQALLSLHLQA